MGSRDYLKVGTWNVYCQVCAKKLKADEILKRWDGLFVCKGDFEHRHPQDFLRSVVEKSNILPFSFPQDGSQSGSGDPYTLDGYVEIAYVGMS